MLKSTLSSFSAVKLLCKVFQADALGLLRPKALGRKGAALTANIQRFLRRLKNMSRPFEEVPARPKNNTRIETKVATDPITT